MRELLIAYLEHVKRAEIIEYRHESVLYVIRALREKRPKPPKRPRFAKLKS